MDLEQSGKFLSAAARFGFTQQLVSIRKAEHRRPGKWQQAAGGELQRCCSALPLNSGSVFSLCSLENI